MVGGDFYLSAKRRQIGLLSFLEHAGGYIETESYNFRTQFSTGALLALL